MLGCREVCVLSTTQGMEGLGVDVFPGISRAHLEHDTAYAYRHDGADLEQPGADGVDLGLSPLGALQAQPAQSFPQV